MVETLFHSISSFPISIQHANNQILHLGWDVIPMGTEELKLRMLDRVEYFFLILAAKR
jgi:hypothetical protein